MEFSKEHKEYSISIPLGLNKEVESRLIRDDGQEDLVFGLYIPSLGCRRKTALISEIVTPLEGDREVHGNVSFTAAYFARVCKIASKKGLGIVLMHSHPVIGWQDLSSDDVYAEREVLAETAECLTGYPLVGMTIGSDGYWSGRFWEHEEGVYECHWAVSVRVVGKKLNVYFNNKIASLPEFSKKFRRTRTVLGESGHQLFGRLRYGIVGVGSVGMMVCEILARMGASNFVLIDDDTVEDHNLDRLAGCTSGDVGKLKVDVAKNLISRYATSDTLDVQVISKKLSAPDAYASALDCDLIFSCVDRPRARYMLNHIVFSHLIPVIDGGIKVFFDNGPSRFTGADWQVQTITHDGPCMECLGVFDMVEVSKEIDQLIDSPTYMEGGTGPEQNENVFPFTVNLASLEIMQLLSLLDDKREPYGIQRFRVEPGIISHYRDRKCIPECVFYRDLALGDKNFIVYDCPQ